MTDIVDVVARAICKSRTCEGVSCCQWPAQRGRTKCPVDAGGYTDAARSAIDAIDAFRVPDPKYPWFCAHCGYAEHERLKHGSSVTPGSTREPRK